MADNRKQAPPRTPGRPQSDEVRQQCTAIGRLLARGMSELEIRHELHLSVRTFRQRMAYLEKASVDTRWVWTKYLTAQQAELQTLSEIVGRALSGDRPALRAATDAVLAKARIRREIIDVGQKLGVYDDTSHGDAATYANPTMGLFLDAMEGVGDFAADRPLQ
jgi:hypothetical protein